MLKSLFKTKVHACTAGQLVPLSDVPDTVFAEGMMGDGLAIVPEDGVFRAPFDGTITLISPTKHAFGMVTKDGIELLVHIGIDTVNLQGEGFEVIIEADTEVKQGTPIIKADLDFIKSKDIPTITPMIVLSEHALTKNDKKLHNRVDHEVEVFSIR